MKTHLRTSALLCMATSAACLSSCVVTQQTIDFSVFTDAVVPAQNDEVQVEVGRGLSASEVYTAPVPPAAIAGGTGGATTYTVRKGDSLSSIARKHNIPIAALYAANGLSPENSRIRIDQKLIIPAAGQAYTAAPMVSPASPAPRPTGNKGMRSYTIVKGDSLSSIARRHGISMAELMSANGITPETANKIEAGHTLNIPTKR